ncbi:VanW family protein [Eubacteriales bacterium OttesenSCG-928-N13]|nr:VanW family protein [Eubacteriales bacterium OttesenSCG-928-N13]
MAQTRARRRTQRTQGGAFKQSIKDTIKMALVVAAIVGVIILIIRLGGPDTTITAATGQQAFLGNVYVNGTEMKGMTFEQGEESIKSQIATRLSTPIELWYGNSTWTLTPDMLGAKMLQVDETLRHAWAFGHTGSRAQIQEQVEYLERMPAAYETTLEWDEAKLDEFIAGIKQQIDTQPVNAEVTVDTDPVFKISQHKDGQYLNSDQLKEQLRDALYLGGSSKIELVPEVWHPEFTYERRLAGTQLIASCKTDATSSTENRNKNIKRALRPFNAMALQPDETVSFNATVGKRTKANGFFEAPEFLDGSLVEGVGGGTCQASTTLYGALRRAGVQVDQRYPHSQIVAYIKPSLDATVTDNGIIKDLVFTNTTDDPIYIYTYVSATEARVEIYGQLPEYQIQFKSKTVRVVEPKGFKAVYDKKALYVLDPDDEPVQVPGKDGKNGYVTEGWLYYVDRTTGEVIDELSEKLYTDTYAAVKPSKYVYYAGND